VKGGDFLANQPLAKGMCEAAPGIVFLLDRMGVPFNRTPEGWLDFRGFGGTLYSRTAFAGATTGQQLLYVSQQLGHASVAITADLYGCHLRKRDQAAADNLGALLKVKQIGLWGRR